MAETNFFSKATIDKTVEEAEKRSDSLPKVEEPGIYTATISDVQLTKTKKGDPMIVIVHEVKKDHKEVNANFVLTNQINAQRLIEYVWNGFEKKLNPWNGTDSLETFIFDQVKKTKGKKVQVALQIKEELFSGNKGTFLTKNPNIWYIGKADGELKMNTEKGIVPLSAEDKQRWADYQNEKHQTAAPEEEESVDDAEIEEAIKEPEAAAPKKTKVAKPAEDDVW